MTLDPNKCMKFKDMLLDFLNSLDSIEDLNSTEDEIHGVLKRTRKYIEAEEKAAVRKKPFVNCFGIEINGKEEK